MEIKKTDPKTKTLFIVFTSVTVAIVFAGWFFSFRDLWRSSNLSFANFSKVSEIKNEVKNITSDFKEEIQPIVSEAGNVVKETTDAINQETEQEQAAKEVIGQVMKDNLAETNQAVEATN